MKNSGFVRLLCLACVLALLAISTTAETQSYPPLWNVNATYDVGDMITLNGNVYRCTQAVSAPGGSPSTSYDHWELNEVRNNTTIIVGVGQPFPTLTKAWTYIENARVDQAAKLHLDISTVNGPYRETYSAPFSLDHGSGARISIIGDIPSNITLSFPSSNGFTIDSGDTFKLLQGVTVSQTASNPTYGIYATQNSALLNVTDVSFVGSSIPIFADSGANIADCSGLTFANFSTAVIWLNMDLAFRLPIWKLWGRERIRGHTASLRAQMRM